MFFLFIHYLIRVQSYIDLICKLVSKQYAWFGKPESYYYVMLDFSRIYRGNFTSRIFSVFVLKPSLETAHDVPKRKHDEYKRYFDHCKNTLQKKFHHVLQYCYSYRNTYIRLMIESISTTWEKLGRIISVVRFTNDSIAKKGLISQETKEFIFNFAFFSNLVVTM